MCILGNVLSNISIIIAVIGLLVSFVNLYYFRKQIKILEKIKFTDEPINAYTTKLESIANAINRLAQLLGDKK